MKLLIAPIKPPTMLRVHKGNLLGKMTSRVLAPLLDTAPIKFD